MNPWHGRADGWSRQSGLAVALMGAGLLLLSGCRDGGMTVPTTEIGQLQTASANGSAVYVRGAVGDRVPLVESTVYELKDGTGHIWVLTKDKAPETGQELVVKGTVRFQSIVINGQEAGSVYLEQSQ